MDIPFHIAIFFQYRHHVSTSRYPFQSTLEERIVVVSVCVSQQSAKIYQPQKKHTHITRIMAIELHHRIITQRSKPMGIQFNSYGFGFWNFTCPYVIEIHNINWTSICSCLKKQIFDQWARVPIPQTLFCKTGTCRSHTHIFHYISAGICRISHWQLLIKIGIPNSVYISNTHMIEFHSHSTPVWCLMCVIDLTVWIWN